MERDFWVDNKPAFEPKTTDIARRLEGNYSLLEKYSSDPKQKQQVVNLGRTFGKLHSDEYKKVTGSFTLIQLLRSLGYVISDEYVGGDISKYLPFSIGKRIGVGLSQVIQRESDVPLKKYGQSKLYSQQHLHIILDHLDNVLPPIIANHTAKLKKDERQKQINNDLSKYNLEEIKTYLQEKSNGSV